MEPIIFGLGTVIGISMISTGLRIKQCWKARASTKKPPIQQAQLHQHAYFTQPLHAVGLGVPVMRVGVPVARGIEFSIERKSVIERGPLFTWLSRLGISEKPLGLPLLDYFFKCRTQGWHLEHTLRVRPDICQLLVMHLNQGALRGFSVRRVVCQRGILWVDVMQTRQLSELDKNDSLDSLIERWVPALTAISEVLEHTQHGQSEETNDKRRSAMLQIFKQQTFAAENLLRNKTLRNCRLIQYCRSTPVVMALVLFMLAAVINQMPETVTTRPLIVTSL